MGKLPIPAELTRSSIVENYQTIRFGKDNLQSYLAENITYGIELILNDKAALGAGLVSAIRIARLWSGTDRNYKGKKWKDYEWNDLITDDDFEVFTTFEMTKYGEASRSEDAAHSLSLICLLALRLLYDRLDDKYSQGLVFLSEIYAMKTNNIWTNINCELDKLVSGIKRSGKERKPPFSSKDTRHYQGIPLADRFLLDLQEIDNLICWFGSGGKVDGRKCEKAWVLNARPEHVKVINCGPSKQNEKYLLNLLKLSIFPDNILLRPEQLELYSNEVKSRKIPTYDPVDVNHRYTDSTSDHHPEIQNILDKILIHDKPTRPPDPALHQNLEIVDWIGIREEFSWVFEPSVTKAEYEQRCSRYGPIRFDHQQLAIRQKVEEKHLCKFLRSYYELTDENNTDYQWYSFRVGHKRIDLPILVMKDWFTPPRSLDETSDTWEHEPFQPPIHTLPKRHTFELIVQLFQNRIRLWNDPTFRLRSIKKTEEGVKAKFAIVDFLRYRFTIGLLHDELAKAILEVSGDLNLLLKNSNSIMPIRSLLLPDLGSIIDLEHRICTGGIDALVAIARPAPYNDFRIVLQVRSSIVSEGQDLYHVIPAGFHQPLISPDEEVNLFQTVWREFYEELRRGDDAEKGGKKICYDWYIEKCKPIKWLYHNRGSWKLEHTLFSLSPFAGGSSFGLLWVIQDTKFWKSFSGELENDWETAKFEFVDSKDKLKVHRLLTSSGWVPGGLAIFVEGLKRLQTLESNRCDFPDIESFLP